MIHAIRDANPTIQCFARPGLRIELVGEKHWMIHAIRDAIPTIQCFARPGLRIELVGEKHWMINNYSGCNLGYPMLRPSGIED